MAYEGFAYLYDELNAAADYDALCGELAKALRDNGILGGIVADLGCGTGEVSLRLAALGYDMVAVDASEDMLALFREKQADRGGEAGSVLLLHQPLQALDLYGTIVGAVSTFDTLNHLPPAEARQAVAKAGFFMERDGILLFDANTPYKHREVLGDNMFLYEDEGFACRWQNRYHNDTPVPRTEITVEAEEDGQALFCEHFFEYAYDLPFWERLLRDTGFALLWVKDGEDFGPLRPDSPRYLLCARKLWPPGQTGE